jgi:hypothetical protein
MLGDHIRALKDGHWLHGIDLGDQRVLFLAETPGLPPGDRLRRVYRPEFTAGARKVELVVHREPSYPSKAVVARAWSRFMDPSVVAMFRDSEAFAAWCKIGRLPETPAAEAAATAPARPAAVRPAPRPSPAPRAKVAAPKAKVAKARRTVAKKPAAKAGRAAARKGAAKARPAARKAAAAKTARTKAAARKTVARKPAATKKGRR